MAQNLKQLAQYNNFQQNKLNNKVNKTIKGLHY